MSIHTNKKTIRAGFSLVEAIIYIALLVAIVTLAIATTVGMVRTQRSVRSHVLLQESAVTSLDRMVREIHDAISVDPTSTLGSNPGRLLLNSADSSNNARTVEFYVNNGRLSMRENGAAVGALTSTNVTVSNLIFRFIDTTKSDAVKIEMTLIAGTSTEQKIESFYTTAILRSSY